MTKAKRVEKLEKAIKPEEEQKVFYSTGYKNQKEFDKAIEDYKASKPKNKPKTITHIGSYEDDLTGEITQRTMFKKEVKDD